MPEYFLHEIDVPFVRRNHNNIRKIYRNCKGLYGPDLISKYPMIDDSHHTVNRFLSTDGKLQNANRLFIPGFNENLSAEYTIKPFRSLIVANRIAVERFNVPYSINKSLRWEIYDQIRDNLRDLQDEEIGLRVSLLRANAGCFHCHPEERAAYTYLEEIISEFHGYYKHKKLEIAGRCVRSWDFFSKPRKKVKKKDRREWLHVRRPQDESVPHDKKMMHLFVKEQVTTYFPGLINSSGGKLSAKLLQKDFERKQLRNRCSKNEYGTKRERRYHRSASYSDFELDEDFVSDADHLHCTKSRQHSVSSSVCEIFPASCVDVTDNEVGIQPEKSTKVAYLLEYVVRKNDTVIHCKRRKYRKANWNDEYRNWYYSDPNHYRSAAAESSKKKHSESTGDTTHAAYAELREFIVPMENENGCDLMEFMKHTRKIDGVYPEVYRYDFPINTDLLSNFVLPEFLSNFTGIGIFQPLANSYMLRIILNPKEDDVEEERKMLNLFRRKDSNNILNNFTEKCQAYDAEAAKTVALSKVYNSEEAGPSKSCNTSDYWTCIADVPFYCCICDACDENGFALQCGHFTCKTCWIQHATYRLRAAAVPIRCPEFGCTTILTDEQLLCFLPLSACRRYRMLLSNKEFMRPQWLHCTNCSKILYIPLNSSTKHLAVCSCGEYMCLECRDQLHRPLTCSEAELYKSFCESMHADSTDMNILLKRCPACRNFCERSDGCNHMTCVCGAEFCYYCNEKWFNYTYHLDCFESHFEVDLFDIPNKAYSGMPLKVFGECKRYRNNRHAKKLKKVHNSLIEIFGIKSEQSKRITTLLAVAYQFLELSVLKKELLWRSAKRSSRCSLALATNAGKLRRQVNSIQFFLDRLKALLDCSVPDVPRIIYIYQNLESALRLCLSDVYSH